MKILIATGIYPPDIGGPATYAFNLKREFEKLGHEVIILTYSNDQSSRQDNIYKISRRQNLLLRYFAYFKQVLGLAKDSDVVYLLDLMSAGLPGSLAARLKNKRVVMRIAGDFLWEKAVQKNITKLPLTKYYQAPKNIRAKVLLIFCRWILKKVDLVIFSTKLQADIYQKHYKVPVSKIKIITNPITKTNSKTADSGCEDCIIFAGRLIKLKNIEKLIKAFGSIKNQDTQLLIFGDGPEKNNLNKLIQKLSLANKIKLLGNIDQNKLLAKILTCKFVIIPSLSDISPNLALECLSMAKPVILTQYTGLDSQIMSYFISIDPESEIDIKNKIEYLLQAKNLENYHQKLEKIHPPVKVWADIAKQHAEIFTH